MADGGYTLKKGSNPVETDEGPISIEHFNHIKKVNDVFYDQVRSADQKAAYIFTFMLAFLMWSAEAQGVFQVSRYTRGIHNWAIASAVLAISVVFTIVCAILVVLPRRADRGTSLYWGAWHDQRGRLIAASAAGDMDYLFGQYLENADAMAKLSADKYRMVRFAFRGLLVTVVAYVLLLLLRQ